MAAIKIRVKTLWLGQVGVRDKYIQEAEQNGHDLEIHHKGQIMTIPHQWIGRRIHARSETPFYDRFNGQEHYLVYFLWQPDPEPQTLF